MSMLLEGRPEAVARGSGSGTRPEHFRIVIVGTGFSGLGMAIRLKQKGIHDFVLLERADDIGGTWRDNTYPGCQCDVPSHLYSFSFAPNPYWSRTFSRQPEIWAYLRGCAKRFGITSHVRLGHEVTAASWDEDAQLWRIDTPLGAFTAQVLIAGMGGLSEPSIPKIPGLENFEGTFFHSATWDHDHDLTGENVAVIGTGASAIQLVPRIQPKVGRLYLFQRTPAWVMPHRDRRVSGLERRLYRTIPWLQRLMRAAIYWAHEAYVPVFMKPRLNGLPQRIARRHLEAQVPDPELRAALTPNYAVGCKRILMSETYYPALTSINVEVVTAGIREIRQSTIVTADRTEREIDTIIFATGFHVTDMPFAARLHGRGGRSMAEVFNGSPQAYRGTTVAGFPNLFLLLGPNTGLGHTSVVFMAEAQIAYIMDCLRTMDRRGLASVEVRLEAQSAFNQRLQEGLRETVWNSGGCVSWYLDAQGNNPTLWPGFTWRFRMNTRRFDPDKYSLGIDPGAITSVWDGRMAAGNAGDPAEHLGAQSTRR